MRKEKLNEFISQLEDTGRDARAIILIMVDENSNCQIHLEAQAQEASFMAMNLNCFMNELLTGRLKKETEH